MKKGQKTTLTRANVKSKSLRTTLPMSIRNQFGLEEGDELIWEMKAEDKDKMIIVVKPQRKKETKKAGRD
jgi:bifunctional DNA-binding transcriptional regulator/antitoxin component of YhaV-PrlF toxin-antitoxin module